MKIRERAWVLYILFLRWFFFSFRKLHASCSGSFFASSSSYFSMSKMFRRRSFRTRRRAVGEEWLDDFDACLLVANRKLLRYHSPARARASQAGLSGAPRTSVIKSRPFCSGLVLFFTNWLAYHRFKPFINTKSSSTNTGRERRRSFQIMKETSTALEDATCKDDVGYL
jgi:hypothetical protein